MPYERSTIEVLTPSGVIGPPPGVLSIRQVIVDTSFLLADLLGATREGRRTTFLEAVDFGVLRPFAAHHVWAEMGRKVLDVPGEYGVDPQLAARIWWDVYVPRIRFVDVGGLPVPFADEILRRDSSDAPTFALAGLLAPVVVLAGDRDLRDLGVAAQSYKKVIRDAGTLTVVSEGSWASYALLCGVGGLMGWGYRAISTALRHPAGQAAAAVGAVALMLSSDHWMPRAAERGPQWWQQARLVLREKIFPAFGDVVIAYGRAAQSFEDACYEPGGTSLAHRAARALAASANPVNRTELARLLLPDESEVTRRRLVRDLGPVLRELNAFSALPRGRWELGRAGVDFGGSIEPASELLARGTPAFEIGSSFTTSRADRDTVVGD
jgi:hypothetical protein